MTPRRRIHQKGTGFTRIHPGFTAGFTRTHTTFPPQFLPSTQSYFSVSPPTRTTTPLPFKPPMILFHCPFQNYKRECCWRRIPNDSFRNMHAEEAGSYVFIPDPAWIPNGSPADPQHCARLLGAGSGWSRATFHHRRRHSLYAILTMTRSATRRNYVCAPPRCHIGLRSILAWLCPIPAHVWTSWAFVLRPAATVGSAPFSLASAPFPQMYGGAGRLCSAPLPHWAPLHPRLAPPHSRLHWSWFKSRTDDPV